jgi:purine-nucleoside phosphorylase
MLTQIRETTEFIRTRIADFQPQFGIILGTGLGGLVDEITVHTTLNYRGIPNFPVSTVESHAGKLIFGELGGKKVMAMQGRFHYYEGYSMKDVTFPVRVMKQLGIEKLFVSNACGGLNQDYKVTDLMVLEDHINLLPEHPLRGRNEDSLGPRFPDMSAPYDFNLIERALKIAQEKNIRCHKGVYAAVQGPTLETRAEYRYLHTIGADVVGMSTVPEVIVARHMGLPCFAISVITDMGIPAQVKEVSIEDVISAAKIAEPNMTYVMKQLIASL